MILIYNGLWLAIGFFTRLPTPTLHGPIDMARAMGFAPLVGAGIGLVAAAVHLGALEVGLSAPASALIAIAAAMLLTGALHEDGLADCADGFGGGRDKASKLAIMKDSRIGSYGTLALIVAVGLRVAALCAAPDATAALVAAHAAARGGFATALRYLPAARPSGLVAVVGEPDVWTVALSVATGLGFALWFGGPVAAAAAVLAGGGVLWLSMRQIGGVTGDALGAQAVLIEVGVLLACGAAP